MGNGTRRNLLRAMIVTALGIAIAPLVSLVSKFFYRTGKKVGEPIKQKVANVNELELKGFVYFSYPATGDPKVDSDPFRQYVLLKTPSGDVQALSRVCVHLWCLWTYMPEMAVGVCPCHGSVYQADTGVAIAGPAYYQPYPTNCLPKLKVEIDERGDVYVSNLDGRVGYGREWYKDLEPLRRLAESNPSEEAIAYLPFWRPIKPALLKEMLERYDLKLFRAYGYVGEGKERKWLTVENIKEAERKVEMVYSVDVKARVERLVKLVDDELVIIPLLREARAAKRIRVLKLEALDFGYNGYKGGPTLRVKRGERVRILLFNKGGVEHELMIVKREDYERFVKSWKLAKKVYIEPVFKGAAVHKVKPGEYAVTEFTAEEVGEYIYVCLIDRPTLHTELGMLGSFIVE